MGNCVGSSANKFLEADDEKIILSDSSRELQGLTEQRINIKYVSNGDDINSRSVSQTDHYMNGCPRRSSRLTNNQRFMWGTGSSEDERIIMMHNLQFSHCERMPCKPADPNNNFRRHIAALSHEQRAGGRSVRRLKVVISTKELGELLLNSEPAEDSRKAALASLVLAKLSGRCEDGGLVLNSTSKSAISVQGKRKLGDNNNNISWRPSLEDIPELFTEE